MGKNLRRSKHRIETEIRYGNYVVNLVVRFNFLNNDKDQNQFQGDKLQLTWTFKATQGHGRDL